MLKSEYILFLVLYRLKKLKYMAEKRNVAIKMVPRKRLDDLCNNRPHQV